MRYGVRWFAVLLFVFSVGTVFAQQDDMQAQLDAFIAEIAPLDGSAVAARITIGNETWASAGGLFDVAGDVFASPDDRFPIASMSKPFMGVTVLMLQEQGVLSLDDPIINWLPDDMLSHIANGDTATIYHLATMTSGIPDYVNDSFYNAIAEDPTYRWTAEEAISFIYDQPPNFAPGESFEYSNTNFVLLQLIVETATQYPLHEVMRELIFEPLGMVDTYTWVAETLEGETVRGYEDFDGDGAAEDVTDVQDGFGLGAGGLVSNTADLTRFYQAWWRDGELLSDDSLQMIVDAAQNANHYGIGVEVQTDDRYGILIGHDGKVLGFTGGVYYAPDMDATAVILYGSAGYDVNHINALLDMAVAYLGEE
jgi:D-alanyl-D-alanine carboxypeptidase